MSKISDRELFTLIWLRQMRSLATKVLVHYTGDQVGVIGSEDRNYHFCSELARVNAGGVTDQLSPQSVKRRIQGLAEKGWLRNMGGNDFRHTMIDSPEARKAFQAARQWWLDRGIPTGYDTDEGGSGGSRCVEKPKDLNVLVQECSEYLVEAHQPPKA